MFDPTTPKKSFRWMERAGITQAEVAWMEAFLENPDMADYGAIKRVEAIYVAALGNMLNSEDRTSIFMQAVLN